MKYMNFMLDLNSLLPKPCDLTKTVAIADSEMGLRYNIDLEVCLAINRRVAKSSRSQFAVNTQLKYHVY
jgi:hypothetical protein